MCQRNQLWLSWRYLWDIKKAQTPFNGDKGQGLGLGKHKSPRALEPRRLTKTPAEHRVHKVHTADDAPALEVIGAELVCCHKLPNKVGVYCQGKVLARLDALLRPV